MLIRALKKWVQQHRDGATVGRNLRTKQIPLSQIQHRLLIADQLQHKRNCNQFGAFRILGPLDVSVLKRAVNEILGRHEILRTTFPSVDGTPIQQIDPVPSGNLEVLQVSDFSGLDLQFAVRALVDREADYKFDVVRGPLVRFTLVRVHDEDHALSIVAHPAVLDESSVGVLWNEITHVYRNFSEGRSATPEDPAIQYADFALRQHEDLRRDIKDSDIEFWRRTLYGLTANTPLGVARPRPEPAFQSARQAVKLSSVWQQLRACGTRETVSSFTVFAAALQILVYRYTNESDVVIGVVAPNRREPELESIPGPFASTLILRSDFSDNPTIREFLRRLAESAAAAFSHSDVSLADLIEAVRPDRDADDRLPFPLLFHYHDTPQQAIEVPGLALSAIEPTQIRGKHNLKLALEETPDGVQGYWEYDTELFDAADIRRMTDHLETLLQEMASNPCQSVDSIPMLTAAERDQILVSWNRTEQPYPRDRCIHQLFEEQVARTPDAAAVAYGGEAISYKELNRRANRLAHRLQRRGIAPDTLVGIFIDRSIEMAVAVLGVLKAGGAYVPLDPAYPRKRLVQMISNGGPRMVVTVPALSEKGPFKGVEVIQLEADLTADDPGNPVSGVTPDDLAYLIYTSGSTGKPKGVLVSHANLVHSTTARWHYYTEPVGSFLLLSPFSFDSSIAGIFWTLTQGGCLVLPCGGAQLDLRELGELIRGRRVTHMLTIPSLYAAMLESVSPADLCSLQTVIVAGETCPARLLEHHRKALKLATLYNEYGPTEGTVWSTVYRCDSAPDSRVPIGKPIPNTKVYLLDDHGQPVPVGVPGELYIGGDGVARGYLNDPEGTAHKFVHADVASGRLYKTGDLALYRPDGNLEFLGRADQQVKVRGFRIELGEVEFALLQHPTVGEAVVIVENTNGNDRLVAYVTVRPGASLTILDLEHFLAERLPRFAVPSEIALLESLPRSPNGKIDRARLSSLRTKRGEAPSDPAENWTATERVLAGIWKAILSAEVVGRHASFIRAGIDSLSVVRFCNRLRDITSKRVAITDILEHPTISSLAEFLDAESLALGAGESPADVPPEDPEGVRRTAAQIRTQAEHVLHS